MPVPLSLGHLHTETPSADSQCSRQCFCLDAEPVATVVVGIARSTDDPVRAPLGMS